MGRIEIRSDMIVETVNGGTAWRIMPANRRTPSNHVLVESLHTTKQSFIHQQWLRNQLTRGWLKVRE